MTRLGAQKAREQRKRLAEERQAKRDAEHYARRLDREREKRSAMPAPGTPEFFEALITSSMPANIREEVRLLVGRP